MLSAQSIRILRHLLSIVLTVVVPDLASAQSRCFELFGSGRSRFDGLEKPLSAPQFKSPARIVLSRFGGQENFHSSRSHLWVSDGKVFLSESSRETEKVGFHDHESILAEQQDFSLGKMVETVYLTPERAELYRRDGLSREVGQVDVHEVVHDATPEEIKQFYRDFPQTRIGGTHTESHARQSRGNTASKTPIKTATLFSVAGQVWDSKTGVRQVQLPWEKEEARKGQALDRKKYKYVWEWGRAAQDVSGEILPLYAANAILNYAQLRAMGGNLADAYVMVHSLDRVNTRLYSRMHPDTIYPPKWDNPSDTLFLVPLKEGLEKYPPRLFSNRVAQLVHLSEGKINDLQALDLLIDNRELRWSEFDFTSARGTQPSPIILNDMSVGRPNLLLLRIARFQMSPEARERVLDYLIEINPTLHSSNFKQKYDNAADSVVTSLHYLNNNGIEISNLDPRLAAQDPTYVRSVLMASLSNYIDRVALQIQQTYQLSWPESYDHAAKTIAQVKINFGVTTSSAEIQKQLQQLGPAQVIEQPGTVTQRSFSQQDESVKLKPYWFRNAKLYMFSFDRLRHMALSQPDFYRQHGQSLRLATWRSQYLMSQADLF